MIAKLAALILEYSLDGVFLFLEVMLIVLAFNENDEWILQFGKNSRWAMGIGGFIFIILMVGALFIGTEDEDSW